MKRGHLNLGLLAVALGLGTAVWVSQKKEEKGPPLTALAPAAVTTIVLEHPGAPALRLEKHDGSWKLVAPVQADTDSFEVNSLIGLADTQVQQTLEGEPDLAQLGLAPPAYVVTLNDQRIEFGGSEPLKFRRYVRHGGKVLLVADPPSAPLDKDYSDLVSKSLLPADARITRIALPGLTVEKNAAGAWTSPEQPQASPEQLQKLVDAWRNAKAMWNGAETAEPAPAPAGEPATVTLADGRQLGFVVVEREPQFVLARPELRVRYTLAKSELETMLQLPAAEPQASSAPAPPAADAPPPAAEPPAD